MRPNRLPSCFRSIGLVAALGLLGALLVAPAHAGVDAALQPANRFVAPGAGVDVEFDVTAAGSAFNGFHATFTYDPAALTFVQASPLANQLGCLVNGTCSSACGQTFHIFHAAGDSLTVDLSLLCDQVSLVGPGQLYKLHFVASNTDQVTWVRVRSASFFDAGLSSGAVTTADTRVVIGSPASVGPVTRPGTLALRAEPNPAAGAVVFAIATGRDGTQEIDVLDLSGRRVRHLASDWAAAGTHRVTWDGRDDAGALLPAGLYLARVRSAEGVATTRIVRTR